MRVISNVGEWTEISDDDSVKSVLWCCMSADTRAQKILATWGALLKYTWRVELGGTELSLRE